MSGLKTSQDMPGPKTFPAPRHFFQMILWWLMSTFNLVLFANWLYKRFIVCFLKLVPKSFQRAPRGSQRNLVDKERFQGESSLGCLNCCFIKKLRRRGWEGAKIVKGCAACFEASAILVLDLSQGWTCLKAGLVQALWAGLVSGLELSHGWTCRKTSGPEVSKSSRVGSVSLPEMSKSLEPEMCLAAGLGSRPEVSWSCFGLSLVKIGAGTLESL